MNANASKIVVYRLVGVLSPVPIPGVGVRLPYQIALYEAGGAGQMTRPLWIGLN